MRFGANEGPGTPPEKLNIDFGANMGRLDSQNRRFCGMRAAPGGKGVAPPSRRGLEGLGLKSLCKDLAMEISNWKEIGRRFSMEILD